jgi:predicted transposase YdaD
MGKADIGGKHVLGSAPETWVGWLFGDPKLDVLEALTEEFRFVLRHSDELLLIQEESAHFLLLTELQLHDDPRMPRRMRAYAALAEEKYDLLMKDAGEEEIREGVRLLRQRGMGEEMEVVLALFTSFVMEPEQIQRIMRWNMAILKESPWYQEIVQEGQQEGLQTGRRGILRLFKERFDPSYEAVGQLEQNLQEVTDLADLVDLLVHTAQAQSIDTFLEETKRAAEKGQGNGDLYGSVKA